MIETLIGLLVIAGIILIPWMVGRIFFILKNNITNEFNKEWVTGLLILLFLFVVIHTSWLIGFFIMK
jgi:hypothetical protein